jgi:hypothetical protein
MAMHHLQPWLADNRQTKALADKCGSIDGMSTAVARVAATVATLGISEGHCIASQRADGVTPLHSRLGRPGSATAFTPRLNDNRLCEENHTLGDRIVTLPVSLRPSLLLSFRNASSR